MQSYQIKFQKYSAQLTLQNENQDVFWSHNTIHLEHLAESLLRWFVVNTTTSILVKWVLF